MATTIHYYFGFLLEVDDFLTEEEIHYLKYDTSLFIPETSIALGLKDAGITISSSEDGTFFFFTVLVGKDVLYPNSFHEHEWLRELIHFDFSYSVEIIRTKVNIFNTMVPESKQIIWNPDILAFFSMTKTCGT